ncbi:choice-of-anchor Q domain-containing protein [Dyadobacter luticola]|uniref:T9SS type A sorting domain-containing protein n=1 Tax=Dyadobacter luticola TaxID=1979387 RepID=A0A5R9L2S1_9BACT|nr:choice-of-anchor Q domain-containing protein [Dyadobacter luticola]TLV02872.1 T9SS type A sorting domain-containing protein [Dyadobacter luticola]
MYLTLLPAKIKKPLFFVLSRTFLILLLLTSLPSVAFAATRYVKPDATGTGASWNDASGNIQNMINASSSGDQVWVAGGTYIADRDQNFNRSFKLKEGVEVYGGFAGTELMLAARDLSVTANASILSGTDATGSVVSNLNNGLTSAAVLNGFTLTGGAFVVRNTASSPMFVNILIIGRSGGGTAMTNDNASPVLVNCTIFNRGGSGLYNTASSPILTNCTIGSSTTSSIDRIGIENVSNSAPQIRNSIIFGNKNGIVNEAGSVPVIRYSLVKGLNDTDPTHHNFTGTATPLFVDVANGNFRLLACSPGINMGSNSYYASGQTPDLSGITTDMDSHSRLYDGVVDMGAYEFQNETPAGVAGVWYVKEGGTGSGVSWACASGSLQITINAASSGDQVWVAGGTYTAELDENFNRSFKMKEGVKIYGGFAGTESTLTGRDLSITANASTLSGRDATGSVVSNLNTGLTSAAVLNGFTVTGGAFVVRNTASSPMFVNILIIGRSGGGTAMNNDNASPVLANCTIVNQGGNGIYNTASSPILTNCTIGGNSPSSIERIGITNVANSAPIIRNSIVTGDANGIVNEAGSVPEIRYSLVTGTNDFDPTHHNLPGSANPLFVDENGGNLQLSACSPAINTGDNAYYASGQTTDLSAVTEDLLGRARFYNNGIVDLGAYEFQAELSTSGIAGVWYVKPGGTGLGKSWDCPLGDLQLAINSASRGEQVWVTGGTYSPGTGPRYSMKEGVKIYGGFAGNETSLTQRDLSITANKSILDANNGPSVLINSLTLTNAAVLDGFTITGVNNGPAIQNTTGSSPKYVNLTIRDNQYTGMYIYNSSPVLVNCTFSGNTSGSVGGGILVSDASPTLINCLISGNMTSGNGGGVFLSNSVTSMINCTIVDNEASGLGGGIFNEGNVSPKLYNSIVSGNNTGIFDPGSRLDIQYSLVQKDPVPGRPAPVNVDPLFVNADGGDYRLRPCSPAVNAGFNYFKSGLTPDLSDIMTDLDNESRLREYIVDMGAYEFSGASRGLATDLDEASANITRDYVLTSFNSNCRLVAYINPSGVVNGLNAVSGPISAKVWVANSQPEDFVKRHYQITPGDNAASATAKVTLFFTQQEFDDFNAVNSTKLPLNATDPENFKANLRIEKRPGYSTDGSGLPNSYVGPVSTFKPSERNGKVEWNADGSYWEVTFDVTGFSGFFVKTTQSALPLNLISFTATKETGSNLLEWSTAAEVNTDNFEVQRSGDARKFVKIATVAASGSGDHQYSYKDESGYKGTIYYRLKMSDRAADGIDGTFTFSKIISLAGEGNFVAIYPNPAGESVTFQVNNALLKTTAILYDITGRRIQNVMITSNKQLLQTKSLPSGLYMLKFADGTVERFMKD